MKVQTLLFLAVVLLASGCMSTDQGAQSQFNNLSEKNTGASYRINYTVSGPYIDDEIDTTVYRKDGRKRMKTVKETPGGTVINDIYFLENTTISCYTGPASQTDTCTLDYTDGIYNFLNQEKWNITGINSTGEKKISGRGCQEFSTNMKVDGQALRPDALLNAEICLDTEKGFISRMNVSSEKNLVYFRLENFSEGLDERIEVPKAVELIGHCTDSFDVEVTPFKQLDKAVLSVNGYNKSIEVPERFETGFYELPQDELNFGENELRVYTEEGSWSRSCYRRPQ